jgi:chaperonin GroEL (HSP60 family)
MLDLLGFVSNSEEVPAHVKEVLAPALLEPISRLLSNAGYNKEDAQEIIVKLVQDPNLVYDIENQQFGTAEELGVFDSLPAVEEALKNATSIATVMGTLGGLVAYPRDDAFERQEAAADAEVNRMVDNPMAYANEANERI